MVASTGRDGVTILRTTRLQLRALDLDLTDVDPLTDLWTAEGVRRSPWDGEVVARTCTDRSV